MSNKDVVEGFFNALSRLDYTGMNSLYAPHIIYSDPLFGILEGSDVMDRWTMTCKNAKDATLHFYNITELDHEYLTCEWDIKYYSGSQATTINQHVKSYMRVANGKIIEHSDAYKLSQWIGKAFGLKGKLLGWTGYFQRKVKQLYAKRLHNFTNAQKVLSTEKKRVHVYDRADQ